MPKFDDYIYIRSSKELKKQLKEEAAKRKGNISVSEHTRQKLSKPLEDE